MKKSTSKAALGFFIAMLINKIFCVVIYYSVVSDLNKVVFPFILSVIICLLFFGMCYMSMRDLGGRDQSFYDEHSGYLRGFAVCAAGAVPFLALNIFCGIIYLNDLKSVGNGVVKAGFFNLFNPEFYFINRYEWYAKNPPAIFLAALLPFGVMLAAGQVGYVMGRKNKSLLKSIIYSGAGKKTDSDL